MGRACRNAANIKNRQPIGKMFVKSEVTLPEFYQEIVEEELNVKTLEFTDDVRAFTSYTFKPQLKTVGPKYGKFLGQIRTILSELDGNKAMNELKSNGALVFNIDGNEISLAEDDLLIETKQKDNYCSLSDKYTTVALDTNLTSDLIEEGYVNEIVSKVQTMRKDSGFDVTDHIKVAVNGNDKISAYIKANENDISKVVLADAFAYEEILTHSKEWDINGEKVTISVEKL
jgi:isoleucyl-tRNA synthetase